MTSEDPQRIPLTTMQPTPEVIGGEARIEFHRKNRLCTAG